MSAKRKRENPDEDEDAERKDAEKQVCTLVNQASEIGDDRPLTSCEFSPQGLSFASGGFTGTVKVWTVPNLIKTLTIRAHDARITGAFSKSSHPTIASTSGRGTTCWRLLPFTLLAKLYPDFRHIPCYYWQSIATHQALSIRIEG